MFHINHKASEEKGKTEQKNIHLEAEIEKLKKNAQKSKIDLTFATQVRWSFFGGLMLLSSFLIGYFCYQNNWFIDFTLQYVVFLFVLAMLFAYVILSVIDFFN